MQQDFNFLGCFVHYRGIFPTMFEEIVKQRLEELGASAIKLALDNELPRDAIRSVLRGHPPSVERARDIASALDLEFYIGPSRGNKNLNKNKFNSENTGHAVPPEIVVALKLPKNSSLDDALSAIETLATRSSHDLADLRDEITALREAIQKLTPDNHIAESSALYEIVDKDDVASARPVSVMELAAAAGGGALELDERVVGQVWFRRDWLDRKSIDSTQCNIISVKGESMEPTLPDGCSILVDRSRQRRQNGHIFVLLTADGLVVKRFGKDGNGDWQLASDHSGWKPIDWQRDTTVVGEVMWVARSL